MQNITAKYGIINENTYSFDKFGFMIDVILINTIIIGLKRWNWLKQV